MQNYIVAARTAQGYDEWNRSTREERLDVVSRWHAIQVELSKEKHQAQHGSFHGPQNFLKTQHLNRNEKKRLADEKKSQKEATKKGKKSTSDSIASQQMQTASPDSGDFEEAIQASVAATSKGNPEEDRMIEHAIRASVMELQAAGKDGDDDDDAVQRAIKASVAEAARARARNQATEGEDGATDHDKELLEALHRSVTNKERHPLADADFDDSGVDSEDDENIKAAILQSKMTPSSGSTNAKDEDLERAIKLSKEAHGEHAERMTKTKTEEEIVLEYAKKQSLAEEEHKEKMAKRGSGEQHHSRS